FSFSGQGRPVKILGNSCFGFFSYFVLTYWSWGSRIPPLAEHQVRLWWICFSFSLLDVELDTLCGTNEEGTQFSNSFDV
ncbi:unnamed protein product, partial [Prunus brigantina]